MSAVLRAGRWSMAQAMLREPPPTWRHTLHAAARALADAGGSVVQPDKLTPDAAMQFLRLAAGGQHLDRGGDDPDAHSGVLIPPEVATTAWVGLTSSYDADYAGDHFIGPARALQLAIRERVPTRTIVRMRGFFRRHTSDSKSPASRGWLAWQNWGGDAGRDWVEALDV